MLYMPPLPAKPHKLQILSQPPPREPEMGHGCLPHHPGSILIFQAPLPESHLVIFIMYILRTPHGHIYSKSQGLEICILTSSSG